MCRCRAGKSTCGGSRPHVLVGGAWHRSASDPSGLLLIRTPTYLSASLNPQREFALAQRGARRRGSDLSRILDAQAAHCLAAHTTRVCDSPQSSRTSCAQGPRQRPARAAGTLPETQLHAAPSLLLNHSHSTKSALALVPAYGSIELGPQTIRDKQGPTSVLPLYKSDDALFLHTHAFTDLPAPGRAKGSNTCVTAEAAASVEPKHSHNLFFAAQSTLGEPPTLDFVVERVRFRCPLFVPHRSPHAGVHIRLLCHQEPAAAGSFMLGLYCTVLAIRTPSLNHGAQELRHAGLP